MDHYQRRKLVAAIVVIILFLILLIGEAMRDRTLRRWALAWLAVALSAFGMIMVLLVLLFGYGASARDLGQWGNVNPAISQWYKSLMQPDNPAVSCCGEADSYWCDEMHVRDGKTFCQITDDRDDNALKRRHIDNGTEFEIPPNKLTYKDGNPTGHSIIFLSSGDYVWCFVMGSGT